MITHLTAPTVLFLHQYGTGLFCFNFLAYFNLIFLFLMEPIENAKQKFSDCVGENMILSQAFLLFFVKKKKIQANS